MTMPNVPINEFEASITDKSALATLRLEHVDK